jgi:hypothetical protein
VQLDIAPIFTIPMGGLWRTTVFVSRLVEPPPATATFKGYPVTKSLIAFDRVGMRAATRMIECVHGWCVRCKHPAMAAGQLVSSRIG